MTRTEVSQTRVKRERERESDECQEFISTVNFEAIKPKLVSKQRQDMSPQKIKQAAPWPGAGVKVEDPCF